MQVHLPIIAESKGLHSGHKQQGHTHSQEEMRLTMWKDPSLEVAVRGAVTQAAQWILEALKNRDPVV